MTLSKGPSIRRVVTGHDEEGRSIVIRDERAEGESNTQVWETPPDANNANDLERGPLQPGHTVPAERGTALRYAEYEPGFRSRMHRTASVDYFFVLEGELEMELDSGAWVHLEAGDVVVQRGTMHAWENKSDRPCRIAAVLIGTPPVEVNGQVLEPNY